MKRLALILAIAALPLSLAAQNQPKRPKITGIDHVRIYVTSVEKSREFYGDIVGLPTSGGGCAGNSRPCFPVNVTPLQQIELEQAPTPAPDDWLAEVAFATTDVAQMRRYLLGHGVKAGAISKDANGAQHFELRDPEGNPIAFIQRPLTSVDYEISPNQVSTRLFHAGFVVRDAAVEDRFYRQLLGFRMYWHGGFKDTAVDWEEIQVPDGSDWIEYMLNIPTPADHKELGVQNHFSLGVTSVKSAYDLLIAHGLKVTDDKPEIGRDGKWSFDIYDPDDTRVEFMEFKPVQKPCCHPYEAAHPVP
ncbi:MAG TPA: VOC family protein [Candidatus Methylomirabilis sp.]|nr:VOC family protein [Candidatus Methylomirabilis sp.]